MFTGLIENLGKVTAVRKTRGGDGACRRYWGDGRRERKLAIVSR